MDIPNGLMFKKAMAIVTVVIALPMLLVCQNNMSGKNMINSGNIIIRISASP
jgi:hypothetical protein